MARIRLSLWRGSPHPIEPQSDALAALANRVRSYTYAMAQRGCPRRRSTLSFLYQARTRAVGSRYEVLELTLPKEGSFRRHKGYTQFVWLNWMLDFRPTVNAMPEKVAQFVETFRRQFDIAKP